MLNRLLNMAIDAFLTQVLEPRIREGSIKAVKGYITAVKGVRLGLLALFALGLAGAVLVSGIVLTVVGLVGLMPIDVNAMAVSILVIGVLLSLIAGIGIAMVFNQRRWLEMSKSYELMDAVLSPWPGMLPPNPIDVMRGEQMRSDVVMRSTVSTAKPPEVIIKTGYDGTSSGEKPTQETKMKYAQAWAAQPVHP